MLRVKWNCPWNQCLFCPVYKGRKFSGRGVFEVKEDTDKARRIGDLLENISWEMDFMGGCNTSIPCRQGNSFHLLPIPLVKFRAKVEKDTRNESHDGSHLQG